LVPEELNQLLTPPTARRGLEGLAPWTDFTACSSSMGVLVTLIDTPAAPVLGVLVRQLGFVGRRSSAWLEGMTSRT
jgi:hypothetical protein